VNPDEVRKWCCACAFFNSDLWTCLPFFLEQTKKSCTFFIELLLDKDDMQKLDKENL